MARCSRPDDSWIASALGLASCAASVNGSNCARFKNLRAAALRSEDLGQSSDELAFDDVLATNEAMVPDLGDETLKKMAVTFTGRRWLW